MPHPISASMRECIEHCQRCHAICVETLSHCLELGGRHAEAEHIRMLMACADICGTSARFMLMSSKHHTHTCEVCAEVCEACARDCERFPDDEMMRRCAEMCRRCAESCRQMAQEEG
jgi:hypothetical protein